METTGQWLSSRPEIRLTALSVSRRLAANSIHQGKSTQDMVAECEPRLPKQLEPDLPVLARLQLVVEPPLTKGQSRKRRESKRVFSLTRPPMAPNGQSSTERSSVVSLYLRNGRGRPMFPLGSFFSKFLRIP